MTSIQRIWAMPSAETFEIAPIGELVKRYLRQSSVSLDPFARNKRWATYTNDLNPKTEAEYHLDAFEFLKLMEQQRVRPDLILFDPPYSRRQVKEVYNGIGRHYGIKDSQDHSTNWSKEREVIDRILQPGGFILSFGWNSSGMGKERGYTKEEILMVNHGGAHNDTIVVVERKNGHQLRLFATPYNNGFHTNC